MYDFSKRPKLERMQSVCPLKSFIQDFDINQAQQLLKMLKKNHLTKSRDIIKTNILDKPSNRILYVPGLFNFILTPDNIVFTKTKHIIITNNIVDYKTISKWFDDVIYVDKTEPWICPLKTKLYVNSLTITNDPKSRYLFTVITPDLSKFRLDVNLNVFQIENEKYLQHIKSTNEQYKKISVEDFIRYANIILPINRVIEIDPQVTALDLFLVLIHTNMVLGLSNYSAIFKFERANSQVLDEVQLWCNLNDYDLSNIEEYIRPVPTPALYNAEAVMSSEEFYLNRSYANKY